MPMRGADYDIIHKFSHMSRCQAKNLLALGRQTNAIASRYDFIMPLTRKLREIWNAKHHSVTCFAESSMRHAAF